MRKTVTELKLALYSNYKGVTFKVHYTQTLLANTTRFSQDIQISCTHKHHIHKLTHAHT